MKQPLKVGSMSISKGSHGVTDNSASLMGNEQWYW